MEVKMVFVTKQKKLAKRSWDAMLGKKEKEKKHKKISKEISDFIQEKFK